MRLAPRSRRPRLGLESLEPRDTPAGTVTASVAAGVLTLAGDDADNVVEIQQTEAGTFALVGTNTQVPGGSFAGVKSIVARLGDGNDQLTLSAVVDLDGDGPLDFGVAGAVKIDLGDGDNQLTAVTAGTISLGSLTVLAGDGQDHVTVAGGTGTGSQVAGNVVVSLGLGRGPQPPADLDTHAAFARLAVHGPGGLKYVAADGDDLLSFDTVTVDRAFSAAGGAGSLTATATDSHFGSVLLTGTTTPGANASTNLFATGVRVDGATTVKTGANIFATLEDVTTGPLAVQNKAGFTEVDLTGDVTVNGNFTFTGARHTLYLTGVPNPSPTPDDAGLPSVLTVRGDLSMTGTWAVDVFNYGSEIRARNLTISSPDGNFSQDYDLDYGDSRLDLTGNLTFRGDDSYFDNRDGQVTVGGNVLFAAGSFAGFDLSHGSTGIQVRTTVNGNLTLTATTGEAKIEADGTALNIGGNLAVTGAGWTDVYFVTEELSTIGGTVTQRGGPADDSFWADGNFRANGLTLTFKDGHNYVQVGGPDLTDPRPSTINGNVRVTTGNGTDSVAVINAHVTGTTTISTGAGADELNLRTGATFDGPVTIDLGGGADMFTAGLALADPFDPTTIIIPAGAVTFNGNATVRLGTGNDQMQVGVTGDPDGRVVFGAAGTLTVDGDANLNTFDPQAGQYDPTKVTALHFTDPTP